MNLKLGIVEACQPAGCRVQLIGDDITIDTAYSDRVRDQIRIRRHQLVAVDVEPTPPHIVWRWFRARIVKRETYRAWVEMAHCPGELVPVRHVPALMLTAEEGDEVFCCGVEDGKELHDIVQHDQPAHPENLLTYIRPAILKAYHDN